MLLEVDGLSKKWDQGVSSNWETMDDEHEEIHNAIRKLLKPSSQSITNLSRNGYGNDYDPIMDHDEEISSDEENPIDLPPKK